VAVAENFRFRVDLEQPVFRRREGEGAAPEGGSDGHGVTVLEKRMRVEGWVGRGHEINVSEEEKSGNDAGQVLRVDCAGDPFSVVSNP